MKFFMAVHYGVYPFILYFHPFIKLVGIVSIPFRVISSKHTKRLDNLQSSKKELERKQEVATDTTQENKNRQQKNDSGVGDDDRPALKKKRTRKKGLGVNNWQIINKMDINNNTRAGTVGGTLLVLLT